VAQDLIVAADAMRADLIVAGGYGHSRLREWALGGVTQGLLQKATRCVLFSH
jgi:nucleotide-binding universal stress UspA family protein